MHQHTDTITTTHEHVKFEDGSHVIVHTYPGHVQVTGYLGGEWIEYTGTVRDAREQARLLEVDAPDALWPLPVEQARRIASAMDGAAGIAEDEGVPWADSPEDEGNVITSERVALDGGHADIDVPGEHVELTVTIGARASIGLALSPLEARRIGEALTVAAHRAHVAQAAQIDLEGVETVTDLFRRSEATGIPASALFEGMDR